MNSDSDQALLPYGSATPKAVFSPGKPSPGVYAGLTASSISAVGASVQTVRAAKLAATMAASPGNASYNRGASSLSKAAEDSKRANQAALMARIMRKWSGKKAEDMTLEEACLIAQRGWKNFRARKMVNMWVKIVAFDGDVFYKNKVSGTLEWEIPALPAMTQAEKAKEAAGKLSSAPGAASSFRVGAVASASTSSSSAAIKASSSSLAIKASAKPAAAVVAAPPAVAPTVLVEAETGDTYVYENGAFYFFDGKGGALLKSGWRRMHDDEDVWYVDAAGTTSWDPVFRDAK